MVRVNRRLPMWSMLLLAVCLLLPIGMMADEAAAATSKQLIYDEAGLLSPQEREELSLLASEYGAERETDILIVTSNNSDNIDVMKMTQDFYDEHGPGYDKTHGNAVILTVDMRNREIYLAGFYKAKEYLDDNRLDKIRNQMTPDLTNGDYKAAFETYILKAHYYMGYEPGVNPDSLLHQIWFQLAVSLGIGALVVGIMAHHSGGRVTVNRQTYENAATSGVLDQRDAYIRTTVTKRKIPKNTGGSGGGGGTTGGGHSHSGSRGSF